MIGLNKIGLNQVQLNRLRLNAPFPAYGKMAGGGGSGDGFPVLPGDVTRWHFGGLTNEMMAAMDDPRIEDADGKGRFLSIKNFAWKGMSGVGGVSTYYDKYEFTPDKYYMVAVSSGTQHAQFTFKVTGLVDGNTLSLADTSSPSNVYGKWTQDGIYTVDIDVINTDRSLYFYNGVSATRGEFTIEILPLYPGFILGDGVDDFAVTEKELNFEDTYTVYTAFIPFQNNPTKNMMMAGKDIKDFYMNYSSLNALSYYSGNKSVVINLSNGFNLLCCKRDADNMTIKNLITGDSVTATANEFINNPGLYYLWRVANGYSYARLAIAGQTICNGYFSTDEDDEKVFDWYKKQYPWLFFDQAWTVTGKTNEDEDRTTIANITGNGNDLVLSNFGFAEGSGYGLYGQNYISYAITNRAVYTKTNSSIHVTKSITAGVNFTESARDVTIPSYRIKVTGIQSGQEMIYRGNNNTFLTNIPSDGIYVLPAVENGSNLGFQFVSYTGDCDITIEQIPEYEGYLVTDGVEDMIRSSSFLFGNDFTVVGEWEFLQEDSNVFAGFYKNYTYFVLYNYISGVNGYVKNGKGTLIRNTKTLKTVTSEGLIYTDFNSEQKVEIADKVEANLPLYIAYNGNNYTKMAFKNLAIYPTVLSKDDCIKAYNYLQTLKAK